jgi:hypothetical protein
LHFAPASPTDMMQPLDRYILATSRAIHHRILRGGLNSGTLTRVGGKECLALPTAASGKVP